MPNTNNPSGFKPIMDRFGKPYNGAFQTYSVAAAYSTALYIGDPVILAGTAQTLNGRTLTDVQSCATGGVVAGVIIGVKPVTQDSTNYRVASTLREVYVAPPDLVYEIQEGSTGTALTANDAGLNVNFVVAAGSAVTGLSGTMIDNATEATTNTLDLHLLNPVAREDNEIGYSCKWLVHINRSQFANQVAGI